MQWTPPAPCPRCTCWCKWVNTEGTGCGCHPRLGSRTTRQSHCCMAPKSARHNTKLHKWWGFVCLGALAQLCSARTKQWEAATPDSHNRHSHALNSRARVKPTPGKGAKHDRINVNQRWLPPRGGHKGRKGEGVRTKRRVMRSAMPQPHTAHTRTQCTSSNSKLIMHKGIPLGVGD